MNKRLSIWVAKIIVGLSILLALSAADLTERNSSYPAPNPNAVDDEYVLTVTEYGKPLPLVVKERVQGMTLRPPEYSIQWGNIGIYAAAMAIIALPAGYYLAHRG